MALIKRNNAEGGTNGGSVTVGNSGGASGNAWANVTSAGGTWTYSNTTTASGGLAYLFTPSSGTASNLETLLSGNTEQWGRMYFNFGGYSTGASIAVVRAFSVSYAEVWRFDLTASGQVRVRDGVQASLDLSAGTLATNTWWRFEWHALMGTGTSGKIELKVFPGDSTVPYYSYTNNACNTSGTSAGTVEHIQFGPDLSATTLPAMYMDELYLDDAAYPGPANTGANIRPSFVQNAVNGSTSAVSSLNSSYSSFVSVGDLLVVALSYESTTATATITDSQGNTYQQATAPLNNVNLGFTDCIYYTIASSTSANLITANLSASTTYVRLLIQEYACADTLDGNSGAITTLFTLPPDSGAITSHYPNALIFGWAISEGGTTTAGTNFNLRGTTLSQSTEDRIVTSTGSYDAVYPLDNTRWIAQGAIFYPAAATNTIPLGWFGA